MNLDQQQQQRQRGPEESAPWNRQESAPFSGPRAPKSDAPDTASIIKKLKTVEQNQSKRYKQRSGE